MILSIVKEVGEHCITLDQGQAVYALIHAELQAGRPVTLDFTGVRFCASPFFNAAIGQLLKDVTPAQLDRMLSVQNLNPAGVETLGRVIENSREYFGSSKTKAAIDKTISDKADEDD
jgi:hypothetical protein